ncbi:MAG: acyl-CoA dehydrogenase family protein [Chloroflexota bacterium]
MTILPRGERVALPHPDYTALDTLLAPAEREVRGRVRAFVDEQVLPIIGSCYERGEFPRHVIPAMARLGLLTPDGLAAVAGGADTALAAPVAQGLIAQELERGDAGLRSMVSVHAHLCGSAIARFGSLEQRQDYLPRMARGEVIGAFSLTEPDHGSDPAGMETTARRAGGAYVLNGHKRWATSATMAGVVVVWARCDGTIRGFLVPAGTPGFEPRPIEHKLSFRASASAEILLRECRVPAEALLPGADGLRAPLACLNEARYGILWGVIGAAEACFDEALAYSLAREQFGRPIGGFQLIQSKLADMYTRLVGMKLLALHLGRLKEQGSLHHTHVSLGKRDNVRGAQFIARTARGILGSHGITAGAVSLRHMANLESEATYEGTDEVHTLVLGRALTGLDAFH